MVATDAIVRAAAILDSGGLVAFPTETVYGLGADAANPEAVRRIFEAKGRPADHPLIVHVADAVDLGAWARAVPEAARQLAQAFWPGPLTLIVARSAGVSDALTGGQDTVGVRVPSHPVAQALLRAFGRGIAAPSANRFGRISPTTADHVRAELGDRVDLVLDGGQADDFSLSPVALPATINPGARLPVEVRFTPTARGQRTAQLRVADNANGPEQRATLRGVGQGPEASITPNAVNFGRLPVGISQSRSVTVTNTGLAPLHISSVTLQGSAMADYSVTPNGASTVDPGATRTLTVTCTPSATGTRTATLILNDDAIAGERRVNLSCIGTTATPGAS